MQVMTLTVYIPRASPGEGDCKSRLLQNVVPTVFPMRARVVDRETWGLKLRTWDLKLRTWDLGPGS